MEMIILIGFTVIIFGLFYFFTNLIYCKSSIIKLRGPNENCIKVILMLLMTFSSFIPPISFSDIIIDWNQIGLFNYIRAIIYVLGSIFLPGACLFKIFFRKSTLYERFNVEPFLLKITIYPLLSLTFLGGLTLIFDQLGLISKFYMPVLFLIIAILFILDILIQSLPNKNKYKLELAQIEFSKFTLFILFIAIGIIIISLGIHASVKYIIPFDSYDGISYANYVGRLGPSLSEKLYTYSIYWGYISYSLSVLSGIPAVNINAMLFPFLYLFVTSVYLFVKAILFNFREIYAILSTMIIITFSGAFYIYNFQFGSDYVSDLIFDGIFCFRFKSFAYFLFITSMAIFIASAKTPWKGLKFRNKEFLFIILGSWFLVQSYMSYFLPLIPALSLFVLYYLFSGNRKRNFHYFMIFMLLFILFFVFFDIISMFFFSFKTTSYLSLFFGLPKPILREVLFSNAIIIYSLLIGFLVFNLLIYKIYIKFFFKNPIIKLKFNPKFIFKLILLFFSILLVVEVFFIIYDSTPRSNFFSFYLDTIFLNIGFVGIFGFYFSYFCFKRNKQLFFILFSWTLFFIGLASVLIFKNFLNNPLASPQLLPEEEYYYMMYWFDRIWYYSIFPLSIFFSIGLITLVKKFKFKNNVSFKNKNLKKISYSFFISIIIFFSQSNTIRAGVFWSNIDYKLSNEEAQIIGWVSKNIPQGSDILIDSLNFEYQLYRLTFCTTSFISYEVSESLKIPEFNYWITSYEYDSVCYVKRLENDGEINYILIFSDQNNDSNVSILLNFNYTQEFGSIEFNIMSTEVTNTFFLNLSSPEGIDVISFSTESYAFHCYNRSSYEKIRDIESDIWYQCFIDFEGTGGGYKGLGKNSWRLTINGSEYGDYLFRNNISQIKKLKLSSSDYDSGWITYFDGFNFSWVPDFDTEKYVFYYPTIIENLNLKNIQYLIYSSKDTKFNREIEGKISVPNELIPYFYKQQLYEYGHFSIYYANEL